MASQIFEALLEEKIETFKNALVSISKKVFYDEGKKKLIHPGEYGTYKEDVCKKFLRFFIPYRLDIDHGFILNNNNEISTQCDIIIYDRNITPLIENNERQRFFPAEVVCGIGEVKSTLSKQEFKKAINKLARNKRIKENTSKAVFSKRLNVLDAPKDFDPIKFPFDGLFSFLICNKLNFDVEKLPNEINSLYDKEIECHQKHNLILSIEDGIIGYGDTDIGITNYPWTKGKPVRNRMIGPSENGNLHIKQFVHLLFTWISYSTILMPEIGNYLYSSEGGWVLDENIS